MGTKASRFMAVCRRPTWMTCDVISLYTARHIGHQMIRGLTMYELQYLM